MQLVQPSPDLRDYVRYYAYWAQPAPLRQFARPVPARPDTFLVFYLTDPIDVFDFRTASRSRLPQNVVVGAQTRRVVDLLITRRQAAFYIFLQPAAVYRLFNVPASMLTNHGHAAGDALGPDITRFHARLGDARGVGQMVAAAERMLRARAQTARPVHAVQRAAATLLGRHGQIEIGSLVDACGVSRRQFERVFSEQIGMAPKRYARIARFQHALRLKQLRPRLTWTDISQTAGYFDQTHLVKDFRQLAGSAPSSFIDAITASAGQDRLFVDSPGSADVSRSYYPPGLDFSYPVRHTDRGSG